LRLLRSEVDSLGRGERVEEVITFGPESQLSYALVATDSDVIRATFEGRSITIELPAALVRQFVESDLITIEHQQPIHSTSDALTILVEKDFVCLDREDDPDNADAYPHPNKACP
jgi:hypothetical protein